MREVVVEAPASSANLGSGFDTFAIALRTPVDRLRVSLEEGGRGVEIAAPERFRLPLDPRENAAGVVASAISRGLRRGRVRISFERKVPVGLGMGSSAASGAASAVALNALLGLKLGRGDLVRYAGRGEAAASGVAHYDNVSAAVFGGFVVVTAGEAPSVVRLDPPRALRVCVAVPKLELPRRKTEYARSLLPEKVGLRDMVSNTGRAALLVAGFARGDVSLIGRGMQDEVVERARSKLIPGYATVRRLATGAGASGVCISGAGPSMLAAVDAERHDPEGVAAAMVEGFRREGVEAEGFVTAVGEGARVVASR